MHLMRYILLSFYLVWINICSRNLPKIRRRMRSICTGIQKKTFLCEYWIISHLQNRVAHLPSPGVHYFLHRFITCLWIMEEGCSENGNSVLRGKKVSLVLRKTKKQKGAEERACSGQKKSSSKSFYSACHWIKKLFGNLNTHRRNEKCVGRRLASSMDKKCWGTFEAPCMLKDLSVFFWQKNWTRQKGHSGILKAKASL